MTAAASNVRRAPISVALVCHSYPPVVGGSEIEAQRVCSALRKRGYSVEVLCCGGAPMPPVKLWLDPEGVPVRIFGNRLADPWRTYSYAFGAAWTLFRRRKQYDIVYFLMSGLHLATGLLVARYARKKIVMKFSGSSLVRNMMRSPLGRLEVSFLRKWADRIMILNPGMAMEAAEVGFDAAKLLWMPNPVDTDVFRPVTHEEKAELRRVLNLPPTGPLVVTVGRLAPEKELPCLLDAFAIVAGQDQGATLVLVGDGPERAALEARVKAGPLSGRVHFAGLAPVSAVPKWLQASDVFALVSSLEGLPCSLIEAMSVSLPSVVSDIPANVQLIDDGTHGLLAPLKNEQVIAEKLLRLIGNPDLRAELGQAARNRILAKYSTDAVVEAYESLFQQVLGVGRNATSSAR